MDFLDEYLPMLKDEKTEMLLNAFLVVYLNSMLHKNNDSDQINKYNKKIDDAENTLMMTKTQKSRDLNGVKAALAELNERVEDMEESTNSSINAL